MNVVEKSSEGLSRTFEVVVPASELEAKLTAKIEEIRPEVRLKGFRPGKVPAGHIRKMFGASIMGDILQEIVPQGDARNAGRAQSAPGGPAGRGCEIRCGRRSENGSDFAFEISSGSHAGVRTGRSQILQSDPPGRPVADAQIDEALEELAKQSSPTRADKSGARQGEGRRQGRHQLHRLASTAKNLTAAPRKAPSWSGFRPVHPGL
jgi:trigger factor